MTQEKFDRYHSQQPVCGRPVINSGLTGGQNAHPGSWPWHVFFKDSSTVFCQGSLITNQWVLTTASCMMWHNANGSVVHLGVYNQSGSNPNEVTRKVAQYLCHQNFSTFTYENDICLVKLSAPVNFTDYIQPVCLAAENSTFYEGTTSWVTGFGYNQNGFRPEILQEVAVPIIGNEKCTCLYKTSSSYGVLPTENKLCAGQENRTKEAIYKDEGTALVTKKGSIWVQSGIQSLYYQDWQHIPSVYTRVSRYQKWISNKVTGMGPGFVTFTSQGMDPDLHYTCPTSAPTTAYHFFNHNFFILTTTPDDSIFNNGGNLTPHHSSLFVFLICFSLSLLALAQYN
ncbi:serine protease 27 [Nematolebias whitei]|uniref:serine protease 27 n=1 Tax=Nematolebias whitei TaxID=451745 RepID=UPI001896F037|nr:serine protease 27 [Nematolebias whitei]